MGRSNPTKTSTPKANGLTKAGKVMRKRTPSTRSRASTLRTSKGKTSNPTKSQLQRLSPHKLQQVNHSADISSTSDQSPLERLPCKRVQSLGRVPRKRSAGRRQSSRLKEKENLSFVRGSESVSSSEMEKDDSTSGRERMSPGSSLSEISARLSPSAQDVTPQPKSILLNPASRKRGKVSGNRRFENKTML